MKETMTFDQKQPQIVYGILGDTYIFANEREVEVEEPRPTEGEEAEPQTVTKYEYDVRHFPLTDKTPEDALQKLKDQIIAELDRYDKSEAVNDFTLNGQHLWLDKGTRNGLKLRFDAQRSMGQTDTTLWYGVTPFALNIDNAVAMLQMLEVYASESFDRTAQHTANILALSTIEEVFNYDYTQGYPAKLAL